MPKSTKQDFKGQRFGRLIVGEFIPDDSKYARWAVTCSCGTVKTVLAQALRSGAVRSCGCLHSEVTSERAFKHGHSIGVRTRAYRIWTGMMDRCEWGGNKPAFANYGARGIRVCNRWFVFDQFLKDMGDPPDGMSLDRVDNDGPYSRENCRWATRQEQSLNTSRTKRVTYNGNTTTVFELCDALGLSRKAIGARAQRRGGDYVKALKSAGVNVDPIGIAA